MTEEKSEFPVNEIAQVCLVVGAGFGPDGDGHYAYLIRNLLWRCI